MKSRPGRLSVAELRRVLGGLSAEARKLALLARSTVLDILPGVEETGLWGGLSYHRPEIGGRVKGAVCMIGFKSGAVRLDFIHGIRLRDPSGLLAGRLRSKRFLDIRSPADIRRPAVAALIREAASLDPRSWAEPPED